MEHIWGSGYRYFASQSDWAALIYRRFEKSKSRYDVPDPALEAGARLPDKTTLLLTHLTRGIRPDKPLPAESSGTFFTNVGGGNELFAIRRGNYYALLYAGVRPPFWMDFSLGGSMCHNGSGLTGLFIQEGPGTVLLGRAARQYGFPIEKWNELTVPVATGQITDGRYFNTGVSRNQVFPDPSNWTLKTAGECVSAPVNYERTYRFNESDIKARVMVRNADLHRDVFQYRKHNRKPHHRITHAWELVPVFMEKTTTITGFDRDDKQVGTISIDSNKRVSLIEVNNGRGGVRLKLDHPRLVRLSRPSSAGRNYSRSVQIRIAEEVKPNSEAVIEYGIEPFTK
jgi:hypothetical protein